MEFLIKRGLLILLVTFPWVRLAITLLALRLGLVIYIFLSVTEN